jgi:hypothetical protein
VYKMSYREARTKCHNSPRRVPLTSENRTFPKIINLGSKNKFLRAPLGVGTRDTLTPRYIGRYVTAARTTCPNAKKPNCPAGSREMLRRTRKKLKILSTTSYSGATGVAIQFCRTGISVALVSVDNAAAPSKARRLNHSLTTTVKIKHVPVFTRRLLVVSSLT